MPLEKKPKQQTKLLLKQWLKSGHFYIQIP